MFTHYFKTAWRNLTRNKLHTFINIGGLIIGFTIGIVILLTVYSQLSYDKFHVNRDKLYQAYQVINRKDGQQIGSAFGYPAAPAFKAEASSIEKASRFLYGGNDVLYKEKELKIPVMLVDEDFLTMFTFPVIKGNKSNPLRNQTDIVITEEAAKKIFGEEDPIGKTVKVSAGETLHDMVVSAIVKDPPQNSTIGFDILARIENHSEYAENKNEWDNQHHYVYVQLKKGATQRNAEKELKTIDSKYLQSWYRDFKKQGAIPDERGDIYATRLTSFKNIHFSPDVNDRGTNVTAIYSMLTVGLLIILIACFNFVNINLAKAFARSKEIAVRKCLGAPKGKLLLQLWGESFLVCLVAFVMSLGLVYTFIHPSNTMFKLNAQFSSILRQPDFLLLSIALLLFVSLVAGGYPSWLMARFRVVETLKGKVSLKRKSILRNSLVVAQFVIACIMISCTYVIYQQFQHLQKADMGIDKDHLISVPLNKPDKGRETIEKLRTRLASNPQIISITGSNINLGRGKDGSSSKSTSSFNYKDRSITTNIAAVDYDYLKTFGLKVSEGRDFNRSFGTDTLLNVIVSESVAKQFNESQLVGQTLKDTAAPRWNVIGIFPDFHLYSMREELQPLTLIMDKNARLNYCFIKTNARNAVSTMQLIKREMASLEPGFEFRGSFVDENISKWYEQEKTMSLLFSVAAAIAIVLSCTGLLAMVLLIVQQRVKEIGLRKVLGATVQNISVLISKDFLLLVFIAVLIATPISWLVMSKWLESFPYRIALEWWMFVLVAFMALFIALLTISINTIKAAMQNPVKSLRTE